MVGEDSTQEGGLELGEGGIVSSPVVIFSIPGCQGNKRRGEQGDVPSTFTSTTPNPALTLLAYVKRDSSIWRLPTHP